MCPPSTKLRAQESCCQEENEDALPHSPPTRSLWVDMKRKPKFPASWHPGSGTASRELRHLHGHVHGRETGTQHDRAAQPCGRSRAAPAGAGYSDCLRSCFWKGKIIQPRSRHGVARGVNKVINIRPPTRKVPLKEVDCSLPFSPPQQSPR